MNCQDARLLIGAAPYSTSPELAEHLQACPECREFQSEMVALEANIRRALESAPAQSFAPRESVRRVVWRGWALAASVLVAVVATSAVWLLRPKDTLAHELVVHMAGEPNSWESTRPVDAHSLESILQKAGVDSNVTSRDVVYARTCLFRGHFVPHLVVQTTSGPVTVMVLASEHVRKRESFYDDGYAGVIVPAQHGSIAVLARGTVNIDDVADQMSVKALPAANAR